ncbi:electron-transferring-flavoprotein dehydrogenase [Alteromonadaceae bacterium Bs31]|nr:electron-transferring-flavoprotein dehydrogenase [Alteromonadaceae bacterium Bs31]
MQRESMEYDVVIVGAGPAGLSAACKIKQLNSELSVCVLEKGSEVGAHILSGAVLEPRALEELFPNWMELGAPLTVKASIDEIYYLNSGSGALKIPSVFAPKTMHNDGNYIVSLGNLCRWLGQQAENLEVEIFPGFSAAELIIENDLVCGVITGDMGVGADGSQKDTYMQGMELRGKYTLFAEGCRGHLGKQLINKFKLDENKTPQHYGLGIKELWKVPAEQHQPGLVVHTAGWPLNESGTGGGGFLYHMEDQQVVVGLIADLSYSNPHVSPFDEFQRYKHHPKIKQHLIKGERVSYGARALVKGGLQALPKMHFPGGLLLGDNAGTLNAAKIKGVHCAMKSGIIAAETVVEAMTEEQSNAALHTLDTRFNASWLFKDLHQQRNFGPALHRWGTFLGSAYAFVDINIFGGKLPWTLKDSIADHQTLKTADLCEKIHYPKPDGTLSFDKLSSVYLSNTSHEEDQPCHLQLNNPDTPIELNLPRYDEPAQRYCPAGVYEVVNKKFQINAANCVHCKTCDIKDPAQNITWVPPEGGGGPNYPNM